MAKEFFFQWVYWPSNWRSILIKFNDIYYFHGDRHSVMGQGFVIRGILRFKDHETLRSGETKLHTNGLYINLYRTMN